MISQESELQAVDFAKGDGLVPAIIQHSLDGRVLMLGYMNRMAAAETLRRQRVVFWSRSRDQLWEKGETSGHTLQLVSMQLDCDHDTLLIRALPKGPVCHRGTDTCFDDEGFAVSDVAFLETLERVVAGRMASAAAGSYTAKLLAAGPKRIAQKVGEEGLEVALAGAAGDRAELVSESADLLYHLLVMLQARGSSLAEVAGELQRRHAASSATPR
ncbi:MAG: bifunctional phosphoribosyl-AMP cyclohydrolase/phosphoribosyl-ATP diphosphatase HisIE [Gammaproteobacteria bacterium]|jgi:phosphoribosyl-ATP pyrophosphohydrolase/phosphoribosyl-AMP cyclohydrolase|nr:bifunctional phosphoribosyl-AMP cyclohydrolase/phosphoribosyl-ATP diphosphatase HisIE [Gammaproteobacteria bacterium]